VTLLITVFAAIISTITWYGKKDDTMKIGTLCLIYWGASLMWLVDAVMAYIEMGAQCFKPAITDMINDTYLGISAVALGLILWLAVLLIKDPKGIIKTKTMKKE